MSELFFVNWPPEDAEKLAELINKKAAEARKLGVGAEVLLRFITDADKGRYSVHVAVLPPGTRLAVIDAGDGL
jgi:hypothetical protein